MREWEECIGTTMIGDIIGSRRYWLRHGAEARRGLQQQLLDILEKGNRLFETIEPLQPSIGDEFQGAFVDWETAACAGLWLRLSIKTVCEVDTRYGFADGYFFYHPQAPLQQGQAWRESRAAIKHSRFWQRQDQSDPRCSCFLGAQGRHDAKAINILFAEVDRLLITTDAETKQRLIVLLEDSARACTWGDYLAAADFLRGKQVRPSGKS